jgi:hypothetical protein
MERRDWREDWERAAEQERAHHDRLPAGVLVDNVRRGRFGDYYTVWYSIAERATLAEAGWVLFSVLVSDAPYLVRYHCAAALVRLLKTSDFEAVELSAFRFPLRTNLRLLRERIEAQIGPRRTSDDLSRVATLGIGARKLVRRVVLGPNNEA